MRADRPACSLAANTGEATAAPEEQVAETGEPVTATEELAASE